MCTHGADGVPSTLEFSALVFREVVKQGFFQIRPDANCLFRWRGNDWWLRRALGTFQSSPPASPATQGNACQQVIENVQAVLLN